MLLFLFRQFRWCHSKTFFEGVKKVLQGFKAGFQMDFRRFLFFCPSGNERPASTASPASGLAYR